MTDATQQQQQQQQTLAMNPDDIFKFLCNYSVSIAEAEISTAFNLFLSKQLDDTKSPFNLKKKKKDNIASCL